MIYTDSVGWPDDTFVMPTSAHGDHQARWKKMRDDCLDIAMPLVKSRNCCVDAGAYIGVWSVALARLFEQVVAFEPSDGVRDMLAHNTSGLKNIVVRPEALGDRTGPLMMHSPNSALMARSVHPYETPSGWPVFVAHMVPLDIFKIEPGLIKINCDGMDSLILLGARRMIEAHKPVLIVEDKPDLVKRAGAPPLNDVLKLFDYTERGRIESFIVLSPN